jgi:hypothetical protein
MFWNMKFHLWLIMAVGAQVSAVHGQDRAMLRMGVISGFEEIANTTKDEDSKRSAEAMITVLFRELKTDFDPKDLDNYILVRVGDFIRTKTAHSLDALIYYEELLGREDHSYRFHALLGRADIYRQSPKAAEVDKAMEDYTEIYERSEERSLREFALFRMIELLLKKKEYAKADEWARIYLDREKTVFTKRIRKSRLSAESRKSKGGSRKNPVGLVIAALSVVGRTAVSCCCICTYHSVTGFARIVRFTSIRREPRRSAGLWMRWWRRRCGGSTDRCGRCIWVVGRRACCRRGIWRSCSRGCAGWWMWGHWRK